MFENKRVLTFVLTSSPRTIFYSKIRPADKIRCPPLYLQFTNLRIILVTRRQKTTMSFNTVNYFHIDSEHCTVQDPLFLLKKLLTKKFSLSC